jgi:hypothetical protein
MEVNEEDLKDKRIQLTKQKEMLQNRFMQAQQIMQIVPAQIAQLDGQIQQIDNLLESKDVGQKSTDKGGD